MNIITPRRICVNAGGWIYYLLKLSEYYELRMIRTDGSDDHRVCDVCHVLDTVRGLYVSGESGLVSVVYESGGETRLFCVQPDEEQGEIINKLSVSFRKTMV